MVSTISQFINGLKVSNIAKKDVVTFPYSKFKEAILTTLQKEGYVKSFSKKGKKAVKTLEVELAYEDGKSRIEGVEQISKNSGRVYLKSTEIHGVRNGYGLLIVTTPKGIMTDRQARKEKVGGEALFKIW